ncbi:MAG: hypothetical protein ACD_34C00241G0003 [uncultured bacterium]|nr:MAG: hypothetical protein ACD_34C00241G0003 [uncultured bacterium]
MKKLTPLHMILIGSALMLLGILFPLLMVLKLIPASFWLCFLTYSLSVSGMFTGFIGALTYTRFKKRN